MGLQIVTSVFAPAQPPDPNPNAADPYDLTTLAAAHTELQIPNSDTSNDAWLAAAITQVSRLVRRHCNRIFQVEGLADTIYVRRDAMPWQQPGGPAPLTLSRWPIIQVALIATAADTPSGNVLQLAAPPPSWVVAGTPVSGPGTAPGTSFASASGGAVTLSQPIAGDVPPGTPITFGLSVVQNCADGTQNGLVFGQDYTVDLTPEDNPGALFRLDLFGRLATWEALPTVVSYYAGYNPLPPDVVEAALRWVSMRWTARGRDPMMKSRTQPGLGEEVFWVGGPPMSGSVPQEIAGRLDGKYRVPVIG